MVITARMFPVSDAANLAVAAEVTQVALVATQEQAAYVLEALAVAHLLALLLERVPLAAAGLS